MITRYNIRYTYSFQSISCKSHEREITQHVTTENGRGDIITIARGFFFFNFNVVAVGRTAAGWLMPVVKKIIKQTCTDDVQIVAS